MMKRSYNGYIIAIAYLMILRVVLNITVNISVFNFGIIFDLVLKIQDHINQMLEQLQ